MEKGSRISNMFSPFPLSPILKDAKSTQYTRSALILSLFTEKRREKQQLRVICERDAATWTIKVIFDLIL
jgi:hypothetical protein